MLYDDPGDPAAGPVDRRLAIRVRLAREGGSMIVGDQILHAVVRRRLSDAGVAAIGADVARGGIVVPLAHEETLRTVERVLEPLASNGLLTIEVRPVVLA
jgi:hypothetical protein